MKKEDAIKLFGGVGKTAEALGMTRQGIHRWRDELTLQQSDQIRGAYMRITEERDRHAIYVFKIIGDAK